MTLLELIDTMPPHLPPGCKSPMLGRDTGLGRADTQHTNSGPARGFASMINSFAALDIGDSSDDCGDNREPISKAAVRAQDRRSLQTSSLYLRFVSSAASQKVAYREVDISIQKITKR